MPELTQFPVAVLLIPYAIFLLLFCLYSLFNLYHLWRFGLYGYSLYLLILLFVSGSVILAAASLELLIRYDWQAPLRLPWLSEWFPTSLTEI